MSIIVVNILAENAFKHQIILSNKTFLPIRITIFYFFNLLTDL